MSDGLFGHHGDVSLCDGLVCFFGPCDSHTVCCMLRCFFFFFKKKLLSLLSNAVSDHLVFRQYGAGVVNIRLKNTILDSMYGDLVIDVFQHGGLEDFGIIVSADNVDVSRKASDELQRTPSVVLVSCGEFTVNGASKYSCVPRFSGNVANNLCGPVASLIYRGLSCVQLTTM